MPDLQRRSALVTGTAHGIGAAIAAALERHGASVHGVDKDSVDVTDREQVAALLERIGPVDILVNNAGGVVGQVGRPLEEVSDDEWQAVVDANLTSTFVCTRAVVPGMKAAGYGRIVNISSGAGRSVSLTGIQAYASAKAGQIGFTRQTAHELGPYGITVNSIAPGYIDTERMKRIYAMGDDPAAARSADEAAIPLRRFGDPVEIGDAVTFLCSERAGYISGITLLIDGGLAKGLLS